MEISEEVSARMALAAVSGPGDRTAGAITAQVGPIETLRLLRDAYATLPGVDGMQGELWRRRVAPAPPGRSFAVADDPDQPTRSAGTHSRCCGLAERALGSRGRRPPVALWARGNVELLTASLSSRLLVVRVI